MVRRAERSAPHAVVVVRGRVLAVVGGEEVEPHGERAEGRCRSRDDGDDDLDNGPDRDVDVFKGEIVLVTELRNVRDANDGGDARAVRRVYVSDSIDREDIYYH